jgi:hypothetical protein
MVAFYPHFVSCGEKATLKDVVGELKSYKFILKYTTRDTERVK